MKSATRQGKPWTEEEYALMLEMRKNGFTCAEIGKKLGRTTAAIKAQCKNFYRGVRAAQIKENVELSETIRKRTEEGKKEAQIVEELGITLGRLQGIKQKFGIRYSKAHRDAISEENGAWGCKDTICWVCKNAMVNCSKPVDGFTATLKEYGEYDPPRWSYMVKECPNFDPEPYATKKGGREK